MGVLDELRGSDVVCWCAPLACPGDVLDLANLDCRSSPPGYTNCCRRP
jgi:hypothetical protein